MEQIFTLLSWGAEGWLDEIAYGTMITVLLALATLPFGLLLGLLVALAQESREQSLKLSAQIYTTIFRGLPELLTLFIIYYGVPIAINSALSFMGLNPIDINSFLAGMIALGVVFSAYSSEVFSSAFKGINQGQYEGGHAIGLSKFQTLYLVILPQLIRLALPGLSNLWLILLKDTALISAIGLSDLLRQTSIAARVSKEEFLFFGLAFLIYLCLSIISSLGIGKVETWSKRGATGR